MQRARALAQSWNHPIVKVEDAFQHRNKLLNLCKANGVVYLHQLTTLHEHDVLMWKRVSKIILGQIKEVLARYGMAMIPPRSLK